MPKYTVIGLLDDSAQSRVSCLAEATWVRFAWAATPVMAARFVRQGLAREYKQDSGNFAVLEVFEGHHAGAYEPGIDNDRYEEVFEETESA